jgi:hypothetical protein
MEKENRFLLEGERIPDIQGVVLTSEGINPNGCVGCEHERGQILRESFEVVGVRCALKARLGQQGFVCAREDK